MGSSKDLRRNAVVSIALASLAVVVIFGMYYSKLNSTENRVQLPPLPKKLNILHYQDDQFRDMTETQKRRQTLLSEMCEKYFPEEINNTKKAYPKMLSSDNQRFLYCIIPKVACTSWKRVLSQANGAPEKINVHSEQIYRYVAQFTRLPSKAKRRVLSSFFKFLFVRHPFERLVSAHQDKFVDTQ